MKKYLITFLLGISLLAGSAYALSTYTSIQVGDGPAAGKILQTDGSASHWVATSTLGLGGITATGTPTLNDIPIWNGTEAQWAAQGTTFSFSVSAFSDGQNSPQLIGTGEWKAAGDISFTASYANGPATSAYIAKSGWTNLTLSTPFTAITSAEAVNYPSVGSSVTFTLNASKGASSDTETQSVAFYNYIYYGVSTATTFDEADVEALATSVISNTKGRTITETAGASDYIVYALPSRLGTVTFTVGGFEGGFESPETVSLTNSAGFTEDYYVYRSTNADLGLTTVVIN
jgi:hypothetical protein